jgi:hypothetical protein
MRASGTDLGSTVGFKLGCAQMGAGRKTYTAETIASLIDMKFWVARMGAILRLSCKAPQSWYSTGSEGSSSLERYLFAFLDF